MIIIGGIILLALFLLGVDSLVKYYITNLLSDELQYGRSNKKVITEIISDTLHKEYDEIISETISKKIETDIEYLGYSFKVKFIDMDYRLGVYDKYKENLENELKEKFDKMKSEVNDAMHDTEVRIDTILKMVRKEK